MPVDAMCLTGPLGRLALAAQQVFPTGHGFEMLRIDAAFIATQMIDMQSRWDRSAIELVREPVSVHSLTPAQRKPAISVGGFASAPLPASLANDLNLAHEFMDEH
jgi:hypothetical protein